MKAVIIEDEIPAQINLRRALERSCEDVEVIGIFDSVKSSVKWFSENHAAPDVIFMDVEPVSYTHLTLPTNREV